MKTSGNHIATIVLMLAVIGYTIYNYVSGRTDFTIFVVCMMLLCLPLLNIIRILIRDWKNKE